MNDHVGVATGCVPPNVIFIMSDDHAAHAISSYGSDLVATPNIDRLANEGLRFDAAFCTNSICTPSRAVILTGQHSHRNGVKTLNDVLDNSRTTFPMLLQQSGYQTAMIGKWHLGHGPSSDPRGFDHWEVLPGQGRYFDPEFITEDGLHTRPGYVTDVVTDLALDWLRHRDPAKPFALMCHHKAVHSPWEPDEAHSAIFADLDLPDPATLWDDYTGRPAGASAVRMRVESMPPQYVKQLPDPELDETETLRWWTSRVDPPSLADRRWKYQAFLRDYLRCAASIDDNVGRVLDYLDQAGLANNTIVIYTSDQGFFLGDHGWYDKRFMYDESLRIPFIMRWPAGIAPGSVVNALVTNADFAPTILDLAGVTQPDWMQGRSFASLLSGATPPDWQEAIYYRYWMHPNDHDVPPHYGVRTRQHKLVHFDASAFRGQAANQPQGEWELFDLESDPHELRNVYDDPAYQLVRAHLHQELDRLRHQLGDTEDYPQPPELTVGHGPNDPRATPDRVDQLAGLERAKVRSRQGVLDAGSLPASLPGGSDD